MTYTLIKDMNSQNAFDMFSQDLIAETNPTMKDDHITVKATVALEDLYEMDLRYQRMELDDERVIGHLGTTESDRVLLQCETWEAETVAQKECDKVKQYLKVTRPRR